MVQYPFTNYLKIDVPATNSNGLILHTTSADSMVYFTPIGARIEDDEPIGIYVEQMWVDTDGHPNHPFLFYSAASAFVPDHIGTGQVASANGNPSLTMTSMIVPSGKNIRTWLVDNTDLIGGTLYVFELPW